MIRLAVCLALSLVIPRPMLFAQASDPNVNRTVARVRGELYRAQDGTQTTVFLVTPDGILLADPLNADFAQWLKGELEAAFPGRPVRYVIYTHVDFDRAAGGGAFAPPAEVVAQGTFNGELLAAGRALPRRYASYDADGSGALERSELADVVLADSTRRLDRNGDGHLAANELWSDMLPADSGFTARRSITLGGKRVELVATGLGSAATAISFPDERVVFVGQYPSLTAPFADRSVRPADVRKWANTVATIEFDTLLAGNGNAIPRAQVTALHEYVGSMLAGVARGYEAGQTVEQIQRGSAIGTFAGSPFAATRDADIASLYQRTRIIVVDTYAAALGNHSRVTSRLCVDSSMTCRLDKRTGFGISTGAGVWIKRYGWSAS